MATLRPPLAGVSIPGGRGKFQDKGLIECGSVECGGHSSVPHWGGTQRIVHWNRQGWGAEWWQGLGRAFPSCLSHGCPTRTGTVENIISCLYWIPCHGLLGHQPSNGSHHHWCWQSMRWKLSGEKKCRAGTCVMLTYWGQGGVGRAGNQAIATKYVTCIENHLPNRDMVHCPGCPDPSLRQACVTHARGSWGDAASPRSSATRKVPLLLAPLSAQQSSGWGMSSAYLMMCNCTSVSEHCYFFL